MMRHSVRSLVCLAALMAAAPALAAGVRDFTRPSNEGTAVNEAQASELTLTLTEAAIRPVQTWVRTAGNLDSSGRVLTTVLRTPDAEFVQEGQRLRAFSVNSRTRMQLGRVSRVAKQEGGILIEAAMPAPLANDGSRYMMEIVVERGPYLSIPNVSIIEEGDEHIVYIQKEPGRYVQQAIKTGLQGELYTQVLEGLSEGDQIVSVGSFFIDAETKLKSAGMAAMPGMDHSQMAAAATPSMLQTAAQGSGGAGLVMSDPAPNARVSAPLYMIHVMFNTPVDVRASGFEVTTSDGKRVDVGEATSMGGDGTMLMAMPKMPLPAGTYKVKWHAKSTSSQALQGEFSFTVQ